ncbi:DUF3892 domain-containing protein [bacterium]|nr:DUF3892 domain-containing protein [bacterium]
MAKWADYCISAVRYNEDETHIVKVKVHADEGETIGSASEWKREDVVSAIERGNTLITILENADGKKWVIGQEVHIIKMNGNKFIRTDKNATASDNLENLPEF